MRKIVCFIKKLLGKILYSSIGNFLPVAHFYIKPIGNLAKNIRQICGKLILKQCGENVNIYPKASFSSKVILGNNSDIGYKARINGEVHIGDNVIMGPEVIIYTNNHNISRKDIAIKYQGVTETKPVIIGDDCWIGARSIILPGVVIGKGSVIGAGAVVSKNIPDFAVAVGNPIKIVRIR